MLEREKYYDELFRLWGKVWKLSAYKNRGIRYGALENIRIGGTNWLLNILGEQNYFNAQFEKLAGKYKDQNTEDCCLYVGHLTQKGLKNTHLWKTKDYTQITTAPFEFLELPIPVNYEAQLTTLYGNWKKFVVGNNSHGELIIDLDKPYDYYK